MISILLKINIHLFWKFYQNHIKGGIMSAMDSRLVSQEPHELKTVLQHFGKRETKENLEKMSNALKEHKSETDHHDREKFYAFLQSNSRLGQF